MVTPLDYGLTTNVSYFGALPEEIIVKILEWSDIKGVLACQRVRLVLSPHITTALITYVDPSPVLGHLLP